MLIEPLERLPHKIHHSPLAIPLDDFLTEYNFKDILFECKRFKCKLTYKACVDQWRRSHSKWTPSGYQWTGVRRTHQCDGCKRGESRAKNAGLSIATKPKPEKPKPTPIPEFELEKKKNCQINRCPGLAVKGENYCPRHFVKNNEEKKKHGECKIEECDRAAFSKGMCRKHYQIEWHDKKRN